MPTIVRKCLYCGGWIWPWTAVDYYAHAMTDSEQGKTVEQLLAEKDEQTVCVLQGWVHSNGCRTLLPQVITYCYLHNGFDIEQAVEPYKSRQWPKVA